MDVIVKTVLKTEGDIVELFGGSGKLAARLGLGQSAVSNWIVLGIPKARWVDLIELAERDGLADVTLGALRAIQAKRDARRPPFRWKPSR